MSKTGMTARVAGLVARRPWPFILFFLLLAVVPGTQIPRAEVDPEPKSQLPLDFPARVDQDKIEQVFGGSDMLMVALTARDVLAPETLRRVQALSRKMAALPGVDRVLSLFELKDIKNVGEAMVVDPAVKQIPRTPAEREALRRALRENDLVYGSVVSKDFTAATVIGLLRVDVKDAPMIEAVRRIVAETPGPEPVHLAGMPLVRDRVGSGIRGDMRRFLPIGLLIMLVFLFVSFRQLRGVVLPFMVVVLSVLFTMGLVPLLGWKIQMITIALPVILLAIANDYGIHLIARYQEVNTPGSAMDSRELARNVLVELASPVAIAGVTTIAGLLCLLMHIIVPAQQLGVLASLGIAYALLCSLFGVPAVLALLPRARPLLTAAAGESDRGKVRLRLMDRVLLRLAQGVARRPRGIMLGFVAFSLLLGVGIVRLRVDTNAINYFPRSDPLVQASDMVDSHFGGSVTFSVALQGDLKDPRTLKELDRMERALAGRPNVGETTSIARVMRQMNRVMNGGGVAHDRIPDTREAVAQLLLMYENSGDPDDFERLVDFGYTQAQLSGRISSPSTREQSEVVHFARAYMERANREMPERWEAGAARRPGKGQAAGGQGAPGPGSGQEAGSGEEDSPFTLVDDDGAPSQTGPAGGEAGAGEEDSPFTLVDDRGDQGGPGTEQPARGPQASSEPAPARAGAGAAASAPGAPRPSAAPPRFTRIGGFGVVFNDLVDAVVQGQVSSLSLSLALVVVIVTVLFRSLVAGLLAGLTLALAMTILFGLMGFFGLDLNLPTAMLSSITIGVGVDYTIHFLWRYRAERRDGLDATEAVTRTLTTSGRGIIINALSVVVGFAVMFISSFVPVRTFGFLVVVSISACLVGALVLMPALVLLIRPRFLEPTAK